MAGRRLDLVGRTFGRLTVVSFAGVKHGTRWECRCDCGAIVVVDGSKLKRGRTRSCGCLMRELQRSHPPTSLRHGHALQRNQSKTYRSWFAMIARCGNPKSPNWSAYGGRGIVVCERWKRFDEFLADMGERLPGYTLDRINVNGNYEPGNCRWATDAEQRGNRRDTKIKNGDAIEIARLFAAGATKISLARKFGVSTATIYYTINERAPLLARAIASHGEQGGER